MQHLTAQEDDNMVHNMACLTTENDLLNAAKAALENENWLVRTEKSPARVAGGRGQT